MIRLEIKCKRTLQEQVHYVYILKNHTLIKVMTSVLIYKKSTQYELKKNYKIFAIVISFPVGHWGWTSAPDPLFDDVSSKCMIHFSLQKIRYFSSLSNNLIMKSTNTCDLVVIDFYSHVVFVEFCCPFWQTFREIFVLQHTISTPPSTPLSSSLKHAYNSLWSSTNSRQYTSGMVSDHKKDRSGHY